MKKNLLVLTALVLGCMNVWGQTPAPTPATEGQCGDPVLSDVTWKYDQATHVLTFSGTGNVAVQFEGLEWYQNPWEPFNKEIEKIVYEEGITRTGDMKEQTNALKTIQIPKSMKVIEYGAFTGSINLQSVEFAKDCELDSIQSSAFKDCAELTSIQLPENLCYLGRNVFENCIKLDSIELGENITNGWSDSFYGTKWYNDQPEGDVYIGNYYYCYKGTMPANTELSIKEGTRTVFGYANQKQKGLTKVTFPNSIRNVGYRAYDRCENLVTVENTDSILYCGGKAFNSTKWIETISVPDSSIYIGKTFYSMDMCTNENLVIKEGTLYIVENAINYAIVTLSLPASLKKIEAYSCTYWALSKVYSAALVPPINEDYLYDSATLTLYVPKASVDAYMNANGWATLPIVGMIQVECTADSTQGTVTGAGMVEDGTEVTLQATAKEGYEFVKWSNEETANPYIFTPTADVTINPVFKSTTTAVEEALENDVQIYVDNAILFVVDAPAPYQVYNLAGQVVYTGQDNAVSLEKGIYLVQVGDQVQKVVVK